MTMSVLGELCIRAFSGEAGNFSPSGSKKVKRTNINFLTSGCVTMCLVLDKEI